MYPYWASSLKHYDFCVEQVQSSVLKLEVCAVVCVGEAPTSYQLVESLLSIWIDRLTFIS